MDVSAILASAAEENYEEDFDDDPRPVPHSKPNQEINNDDRLPRRGGRDFTSAVDILRESAGAVEKEEREKATRVIREVSEDVAKEKNSHRLHDDDSEELIVRKPHDGESKQDSDGDDEESDTEVDVDPLLVTTFLASVQRGDMREVQRCIGDKEVPISCKDKHGWSAIHWAASKGHADIVSYILDQARSQGKNTKKIVNAKEAISGWTALHVACIHCHIQVVRVLLDSGANTRIVNSIGELPVDCIGAYRNAEDVYRLVCLQGHKDEFKSLQIMLAGEEKHGEQ